MDAYLADLSRSIEPAELGRRIRAARVAAGLTQSQLAAGEVSAAYISRIEDGQRRPEVRLLERLANRAGTTAHELLTGVTPQEARSLELRLEHAATAIALGEPGRAVEQIDDALDRLGTYRDPTLEVAALRIRAEARHRAGDLDGAIADLEPLARSLSHDINALRAKIALCVCHSDRGLPGDADRAIAIGTEAEHLASELGVDGLAETLRLGAGVARAYLIRGDPRAAKRVCVETWRKAQRHQTPEARANAYLKASATEATAHGATPAAVELAQVALALADAGESTVRLQAVMDSASQAGDV